LKIRVHEIQDQRSLEESGEIPAAALPLDTPDRPELVAPARVHIYAGADKEWVWAHGTVNARVKQTCARCLKSFESNLRSTLEMKIPATETFLEVDDEVRQSLLLALPPQPLCRPECRGLCPKCGNNRNTNPCTCSADTGPSPFDELKKLIK
jgi:uncharacterized protein